MQNDIDQIKNEVVNYVVEFLGDEGNDEDIRKYTTMMLETFMIFLEHKLQKNPTSYQSLKDNLIRGADSSIIEKKLFGDGQLLNLFYEFLDEYSEI